MATVTMDGRSPLVRTAALGDEGVLRNLLGRGACASASDDTGATPIHLSAAGGFHECVAELLRASTDANAQDSSGVTPLHRACERGSAECARLLLDAGADPAAEDGDGRTPAQVAALWNNFETFSLLASRGAAIGKRGDRHDCGRTFLHWLAAARYDERVLLDCMRLLAAEGADVNAQDSSGITPLHLACERHGTECARWLLDVGADQAAEDDRGRTPAYVAAQCNNFDTFALLAARGAALGKRGDRHDCGRTFLHWLAEATHDLRVVLDCMRMLTAGGADVNAQDDCGVTPLHLSCERGRTECVRLLLDAGADPAVEDSYGRTPTFVAVQCNNFDTFSLFVSRGAVVLGVKYRNRKRTFLHLLAEDEPRGLPDPFVLDCMRLFAAGGADVNAQDSSGNTPLHLACELRRTECVRWLLDGGADPGKENHRGRTPLLVACLSHSLDAVRLLLSRGADADARDHSGQTPLHVCLERPWPEQHLVRLLLEAGADPDGGGGDGAPRPLETAEQRGLATVALLLLAFGAEPVPAPHRRGPMFTCASRKKILQLSEGRCAAAPTPAAAGQDATRPGGGCPFARLKAALAARQQSPGAAAPGVSAGIAAELRAAAEEACDEGAMRTMVALRDWRKEAAAGPAAARARDLHSLAAAACVRRLVELRALVVEAKEEEAKFLQQLKRAREVHGRLRELFESGQLRGRA